MSQNSEKLTNILLNGKNYLQWTRTMIISLNDRDKLEFVTGEKSQPKPAKPNEPDVVEKKSITEWKKTDNLITSWLLNCMEPAVQDLVMYEETSQGVWKKIESLYGQKNNYSRIFQLQQEIQRIKQTPNQSINELLSQIHKKRVELRTYRPQTTNLEELQKRAQQDEVFHFLASLDSSYESVRSQILLSGDLPSFDKVASMVQNEESRRTVMNAQPIDTGEAKAFSARPEVRGVPTIQVRQL